MEVFLSAATEEAVFGFFAESLFAFSALKTA